MTTCNICCEDYNKSTRCKVTCKCGFESCKTCVRTYLLSTTQDPHCMDCKTQWTNEFLVENLNRAFIDGDYKKHRKTLLVEREISKTSELMHLVERTKLVEDKNVELQEAEKQMKEAKLKYQQLENACRHKRNELIRIKHGDTKEEKKKFIMPCPADNCKGYLSTQYKCEVCKLHTCPDCFEVIGYSKDDEHTCNPEHLESAKMIKKETKGCPKCGVRIFKISGCDQMWCTECQVAFSWNTGKIIYGGQIHNPHYYEYMRNNATGGQAPRNPGDVLCGGLLAYYTLNTITRYIDSYSSDAWFKFIQNDAIVKKFIDAYSIDNITQIGSIFRDLHRVINHITNQDLARCRERVRSLGNNDDLTVQYILNRKNKDELASTIIKNDGLRKKYLEVLNVYELLSVVGIEKFNNFSHEYNTVIAEAEKIKKKSKDSRIHEKTLIKILHMIIELIGEYNILIDYCNNQFKAISYTFNKSVTNIEIKGKKYNIITKKFSRSDVKNVGEIKDTKLIEKSSNNSEASCSYH